MRSKHYIQIAIRKGRKENYCSVDCMSQSKIKSFQRKCINCDTEFQTSETKNGKYCSSSCAAKVNNPKRAKVKVCPYCKIEFSSMARTYCSLKCSTDIKKIYEISETNSPPVIKRILLEQRGYKCEGCDNTEWKGVPIPLELEHKDGNSGNNFEDNLLLLCPNCHALTPTYKGRNKGNGRAWRRLRYQKGQSY